jgi:hypothetical protein
MDDDQPPDRRAPDAKPYERRRFDPENLVRSVIATPLLRDIEMAPAELRWVIIDVNLRHSEGRQGAKNTIYKLVEDALREAGDANSDQKVNRSKSDASQQYVYARLQGNIIRSIVATLVAGPSPPPARELSGRCSIPASTANTRTLTSMRI